MKAQNFIEAVGDVVAFITGSSVSVADATNSAQQAVAEQATSKKVIATAGAANDLFGVVAGGMQQTLQQFSPTSEKATELLGKAGATASVFGISLAAVPITNKLFAGRGETITTSELDALSGAVLLAGTVMFPQVAVALTVLGSLMVAASILDTNDQNTLSNGLTQLKNLIQPYYSQLTPSDQAEFQNTMSDAMQSTLSGGMLIPQVNDAGWIIGYTAEKATTVVTQGDGGTLYTFESGVTYLVGTVSDDGPLKDPSVNAGKSVWTVPETEANNPAPQTDANKPLTLDIYKDGCYTSHSTDSDGNLVTEVFITGSSSTYTVAPMSNPSGGGEFQFVYVMGTDNQVTVLGDNNMVSLAPGNRASIEGAGNTIYASEGTTVTLGSASGNVISNEITGENISVADGIITVSGNPNGELGGATFEVGATNDITIKADGSQDLVVKYDDETIHRRTYNAADVMTEWVYTTPDGFRMDTLYDPLTGKETQMTMVYPSGSGSAYKYNSEGPIEMFNFIADGSGTRFFLDPLTHGSTGMNKVHADGSETVVYRSPGSLTMTMLHSSNAANETTLTAAQSAVANNYDSQSNGATNAYSAPDHQVAQLIDAMAAYAPEPSASITLAATQPENQLLLAASSH
ncbi:hypothetical protein [Paraburkholderia domus]|uniref:hypothetical protein n=1 Tax=Paraburkholderia domus TaxID=2793075 RepID=UPI001B26A632|nr:hypothetical protein [Paraburkholderia domus]CAE6811692.1 hypothetical protein R75483_05823 [Paraburkholderia domus]